MSVSLATGRFSNEDIIARAHSNDSSAASSSQGMAACTFNANTEIYPLVSERGSKLALKIARKASSQQQQAPLRIDEANQISASPASRTPTNLNETGSCEPILRFGFDIVTDRALLHSNWQRPFIRSVIFKAETWF